VLTVLATDRYDAKASFSNYGKNIVDLGAPGVRIETTRLYLGNPTPGGTVTVYNGTSAAAAYASSGAALVFALNPKWTPKDVIEHLTASADTVEGLKLVCIGGKRLNLGRAVYGPLHITAPAQGDTLNAGIQTQLTWEIDYTSSNLKKVKIEFSKDDWATSKVLKATAINDGAFKWKPAAGDVTATGRIRITPTKATSPSCRASSKLPERAPTFSRLVALRTRSG